MLSLRPITSVVWAFLGFMVTASLVLNMRYKTLSESDALYLDTWTGRIHSSVVETKAVESPAPRVSIIQVPRPAAPHVEIEILELERLRERVERLRERHECHEVKTECEAVRFAYPAPVVRFQR
jgi:hypothetical protein